MNAHDQILEQATRLFANHGFDGTSLKDISDAVGIRKASLLYHFASKDALRKSVLDQLLSCWRERVPHLLMATTSGKDQFEAIFDELLAFFADDPDRARLLLRETLDRPVQMRALITEHVTPWVGAVADQIRRGQRSGRVHEDIDPEAYLVQSINLAIASIATFDCVGVLLDDEHPEEKYRRNTAELRRVARASLFRARPVGPAGRNGDQRRDMK